ncbi:MAG: hypothetical protein V7K24_29460 [Nostoc sp.]
MGNLIPVADGIFPDVCSPLTFPLLTLGEASTKPEERAGSPCDVPVVVTTIQVSSLMVIFRLFAKI